MKQFAAATGGCRQETDSMKRRAGSARAGRTRGHGDEPVFIGFVGVGNGEGDRHGDSIGVNRVLCDYRTLIGEGFIFRSQRILNEIPCLCFVLTSCSGGVLLMAIVDVLISLVVGNYLQ
jgi:hypothetical protein